jgi:acyl-coenzyme A thioesterase PaaI-like protein
MPSVTPPAASAPAGFEPIHPFPELGSGRSFVSDDPAGDRLRVAYFRRGDEPGVLAKAWFGPGAEGPPGHAHGGSVAAILDEALGAAAWVAGHIAVVARLTIDMREMVPLGTDTTVEARVVGVDGRKVVCRARLFDGDTLFAEGEALCVTLTGEQMKAFGSRRQPV